MKGISLVICTHNGQDRLLQTLEHVIQQKVKHELQWELIVIDNSSTDGTIQFCTSFLEGKSISWRVISEPMSGLSHARKAGVLSAQYDYVIFCDDDNWLNPTYVQLAFDLLELKPDVGILGGQGTAEAEANLPPWFQQYAKSYAVGAQNQSTGYVVSPNIIYGAGLVLRKQLFLDIHHKGFSSYLADRSGSDLVSGGDNEICLWYRWAGYKLYYDERLQFRHFIPATRLTQDYLLKRSFGKGKTEAVLSLYTWIQKGKEIPWLESKLGWSLALIKRIALLCSFSINPFLTFDQKMKKSFLKSSIIFRMYNYKYLVVTSGNLQTLLKFLSARAHESNKH